MPILKYRCKGCSHEFAKIFFSPDKAPEVCPVCGDKDPVVQGEAFHADKEQALRALSFECNSCAQEHVCGSTGCSSC